MGRGKRERGGTVHGMRRETDLKRRWWWGTGWCEWSASLLSPGLFLNWATAKGQSWCKAWSNWGSMRWCLWLLSTLKALQRPVVGTATWSQVSIWGPCQSEWPELSPGAMVTSGSWLLPQTVSGSMVLSQLVTTSDPQRGPCWIEWLTLSPEAMVASRYWLLSRTMSRSMVLPQPVSLLMSMAHIATRGHKDAQCLGHNLRSCGCPGAMLPPRACWPECPALSPWAMVSPGPGMLLRVISGSVPLQQLGSELTSVTSITSKDHVDIQDLIRHLRPCWCPKAMLLPGPYWSWWPVLPPELWWYLGPSCSQGPHLGPWACYS